MGGIVSRGTRYTESFKIEAVKQVTERGYSVVEVANRLGISSKTLSRWKSRYSSQLSSQHQGLSTQQSEIAKLKAEVKRLTEERDILKKAAAYFARTSD